MRAPSKAFFKAYGIYRSDVLLLPVNSGRGAAFRAVGESLSQPVLGSGPLFASLHGHPGPAQAIGRAGKNAPSPSSTMSSAGYSLKGCSPALPFSASPVTIRITYCQIERNDLSSNGSHALTERLTSGAHPNLIGPDGGIMAWQTRTTNLGVTLPYPAPPPTPPTLSLEPTRPMPSTPPFRPPDKLGWSGYTF
jgi:hypothetical protein